MALRLWPRLTGIGGPASQSRFGALACRPDGAPLLRPIRSPAADVEHLVHEGTPT